MSANIQRVSILLRSARQTVGRNYKSTFVYDVDKTASQKWIQSRVAKIQEQQKFYGADDGIPIWWKSTGDKVMTTFVFASTITVFVGTLVNLVKFSQGKL